MKRIKMILLLCMLSSLACTANAAVSVLWSGDLNLGSDWTTFSLTTNPYSFRQGDVLAVSIKRDPNVTSDSEWDYQFELGASGQRITGSTVAAASDACSMTLDSSQATLLNSGSLYIKGCNCIVSEITVSRTPVLQLYSNVLTMTRTWTPLVFYAETSAEIDWFHEGDRLVLRFAQAYDRGGDNSNKIKVQAGDTEIFTSWDAGLPCVEETTVITLSSAGASALNASGGNLKVEGEWNSNEYSGMILETVSLQSDRLSGSEQWKLRYDSGCLYTRMLRFGSGIGEIYLERKHEFSPGDILEINFHAFTSAEPRSKINLAGIDINLLLGEQSVYDHGIWWRAVGAYHEIGESTLAIEVTDENLALFNSDILAISGQNFSIQSICLKDRRVSSDEMYHRYIPPYMTTVTLVEYSGSEAGYWPSYNWGFATKAAVDGYNEWYNSFELSGKPMPTHDEIRDMLSKTREGQTDEEYTIYYRDWNDNGNIKEKTLRLGPWPWGGDAENPDTHYVVVPPFASSIGDKVLIEFDITTDDAEYGDTPQAEIQFWCEKEDGSIDVYRFADGAGSTGIVGDSYEIVINEEWQKKFKKSGFYIKGRSFRLKNVKWLHRMSSEGEDAPRLYHIPAENFDGADNGFRNLCYGRVPFFYVFFQDAILATEYEAPRGEYTYYGSYEGLGGEEYVLQYLFEGNQMDFIEIGAHGSVLPDVAAWYESVEKEQSVASAMTPGLRKAGRSDASIRITEPTKLRSMVNGETGYSECDVTTEISTASGTSSRGNLRAQRIITAKTDVNGNIYPMSDIVLDGGVATLENYRVDPDMQLLYGLAHDGLYINIPGNADGVVSAYIPSVEDLTVSKIGSQLTGVEDVVMDENPDELILEAYTLDGIRVSQMLPGRIYIVRCGNRFSRILAR